jgi:hypothetical protein
MYDLCDQIHDFGAYFLMFGVLTPSCRLKFRSHIANPPFLSRWPTWIGASGPRLQVLFLQQSQHSCNRSTSRRKTPCHGFQDSNR